MAAGAVGDSGVGAYGGAVEAYYAARGVDGVVQEVDTFAFAHALTFTAVYAQVGVDVDVQHGVARSCAEECADGADGVAQEASALP